MSFQDLLNTATAKKQGTPNGRGLYAYEYQFPASGGPATLAVKPYRPRHCRRIPGTSRVKPILLRAFRCYRMEINFREGTLALSMRGRVRI